MVQVYDPTVVVRVLTWIDFAFLSLTIDVFRLDFEGAGNKDDRLWW